MLWWPLVLVVALRSLPQAEEALAFPSDHSDLEISPQLILMPGSNSPIQVGERLTWWQRFKHWWKSL